jgi:hypothetical protein
MHQVPMTIVPSPWSEMLICVTVNELLFASIANGRKTVLRHFPVPGVPKRIVHSKYLNQLIVATERRQKAQDGGPAKQVAELCFMPATPSDPDSTALARSGTVRVGNPGETIKALVEYSPSDERKRLHYEMVVIALTEETPEENGTYKPTSRILVLSLVHIMKGNWPAARAKEVAVFRGKTVSALCPMGLSTILIGVGNEIVEYTLDVERRKWNHDARFTLPSAATSLHAEGSLAFIACFKHSLLLLHYNGIQFSVYGSDTAAKRTTNVLGFDKYKAVVTSITEKGTNVIGFAEDRLRNGYGKLFDAQVPLMIDRLRPDHSIRDGKASFIGITVEGTLYRFTTINAQEWALLSFIQGLWQEEKEPPPFDPTQRRSRNVPTLTGDQTPTPVPVDMHVNGNKMVEMLDQGREVVRELLGFRIKSENGSPGRPDGLDGLKRVAHPVVGHHEDMVGAVDLWLRKLMRWPAG